MIHYTALLRTINHIAICYCICLSFSCLYVYDGNILRACLNAHSSLLYIILLLCL